MFESAPSTAVMTPCASTASPLDSFIKVKQDKKRNHGQTILSDEEVESPLALAKKDHEPATPEPSVSPPVIPTPPTKPKSTTAITVSVQDPKVSEAKDEVDKPSFTADMDLSFLTFTGGALKSNTGEWTTADPKVITPEFLVTADAFPESSEKDFVTKLVNTTEGKIQSHILVAFVGGRKNDRKKKAICEGINFVLKDDGPKVTWDDFKDVTGNTNPCKYPNNIEMIPGKG
ncbi:hypothetical protein AGABI1DRAFT_95766 [Agaricus bisporus var. burnettii JB137-S8]|uniref:Uncharacterized protein n=1 Tax=Agaricus bisporus var. burnettii (strain JB137-S8 / ATCC MYA-4627 / FGSC 10392) TaxID=597362 RepID=K5XIH7_AGABU|nr:uncharacterized protein AGABI1DRAFT_95766 [Agaricus bisporus var. burnettii JB137-S8]EKM74255.1 hypothetical protein AGABI1DRAFT_95766 [Agaricus bisporus var. burnettii JB137-S8]